MASGVEMLLDRQVGVDGVEEDVGCLTAVEEREAEIAFGLREG